MELRDGFVEEIKSIIEQSRQKAIRSVDHIRVMMYWGLGRKIVEEEQQGKHRADYGSYLLKSLSKTLKVEFGDAFNVRQLERYRQFYKLFPIASALLTQFSWTHYKLLLSVVNQSEQLLAELKKIG